MLKRYDLGCLPRASYLIADGESGTAVVVDPQRDIAQYLQDATQHWLHSSYVFLAPFQADFLAGHSELWDRAGTTICLEVQALADCAFTPLAPDETRVYPAQGAVLAIATILALPGYDLRHVEES